MNILDRVRAWRRSWRPIDKFSDGSTLAEVHQYCIRYTDPAGRSVEIGFEMAAQPDVDYIIHRSTIDQWNGPHKGPISDQDRERILQRLVEYCEARNLHFRIVAY
ncbi:MAG: Imm74 family immunity protein [Gammaproteobacteria bacterium]